MIMTVHMWRNPILNGNLDNQQHLQMKAKYNSYSNFFKYECWKRKQYIDDWLWLVKSVQILHLSYFHHIMKKYFSAMKTHNINIRYILMISSETPSMNGRKCLGNSTNGCSIQLIEGVFVQTKHSVYRESVCACMELPTMETSFGIPAGFGHLTCSSDNQLLLF